MKKLILLNLFLSAVCIALIALFYFARPSGSERIAFINTQEVYNNFLLKKQLQGKIASLKKIREHVLDSLKADILKKEESVSPKDESGKDALLQKKKAYLDKEKQFNLEDQNIVAEYDNQLWTQLNQYIKNFGTEKGYSIIMGATGNGNLMYASRDFDITKEVTAYANEQYEGGIK